MDDEDSILPHKLQAALEHVLERRKELACDVAENPGGELRSSPYGNFFPPLNKTNKNVIDFIS